MSGHCSPLVALTRCGLIVQSGTQLAQSLISEEGKHSDKLLPFHGESRDSLINRLLQALVTIIVAYLVFGFSAVALAFTGQLTPQLSTALLEVFPALVAIALLVYVVVPEASHR